MNDRVQRGDPSAVHCLADADAYDMCILRCTKAGRLVAHFSASSRLYQDSNAIPGFQVAPLSDEPIKILRIEDSQALRQEVAQQKPDQLLHPEDGMSILIVRGSCEGACPASRGPSAGPECTASGLTLIRVGLDPSDGPPLMRHVADMSMADVYPDSRGRYLAFRQQAGTALTSFRAVRLLDLKDECVLSTSTVQLRPCNRLRWQLSWSPGCELVAIWEETAAPTDQPEQTGRHESSHILFFQADSGQIVSDIALQRPLHGPELEMEAAYAWSPDAQQFAFWGQPTAMVLDKQVCLVLVDVPSGQLLTWIDEESNGTCIGLEWAVSSRWLMVTMGKVGAAARGLGFPYQGCSRVAIDASDCGELYRFFSDRGNAIPILMVQDSVIEACEPALVRMHVSPYAAADGTNNMPGRQQMYSSCHKDFPQEFAEGIVALSPDGNMLVCVVCVLVGDACDPSEPLQRESWDDCPPDRKRLELHHYEPFEGAGFGCYVMDLLEFPEELHELEWGLTAEDIAWKPCCPPGRQIYAVMTAKFDLVVVGAFDQHVPLKTWKFEELVSMGLDDRFKQFDEAAVSLSWSADGSYLLCSPMAGETSHCIVLAFC